VAVYETALRRRESVAEGTAAFYSMQSMLEGLGINENDMRSEEFYSY